MSLLERPENQDDYSFEVGKDIGQIEGRTKASEVATREGLRIVEELKKNKKESEADAVADATLSISTAILAGKT